LWSNINLNDNSFIQEIKPFINLKIWNCKEEIKNTCVENFNVEEIHDDLCYLEGDLFRLLVLNKYGGFYIDMDVLVLRNMSPLNEMEFLYQWGTSGFNGFEQLKMNGAIMRFNQNSKASEQALQLIQQIPPTKGSTCWGSDLYSYIADENLYCLPGVWFNSEWGFEGTLNEPFKKVENINLFEGAFTWHWHNRWNDFIEDGCKFSILEKNQNKIFNTLLQTLT